MDKINSYVHEKIEVDDRILLTTLLKTDKAYIADVQERDFKQGVGIYHIKNNLGQLFAYFDEHPSIEDARPYWSITYIIDSGYKNVKKDMKKILDALLVKKILKEPVWIHNLNLEPYREGSVMDIRKGKIFPDDE